MQQALQQGCCSFIISMEIYFQESVFVVDLADAGLVAEDSLSLAGLRSAP
jgi:hypothetical protein